MKARIPTKDRLTNHQKELIRMYAEEEIVKYREVIVRKYFKMMALALRDPLSPKGHGMGATQIWKVLERIAHYADIHENDPEFWEETDHIIIDKMGIPLEREELK